MSKLKRPSFLALNSVGHSECYSVRGPKSKSRVNNLYSPTNSVESEYSPACTPTSPDYLSTPTKDEFHLPFAPAFRSTVPISATDYVEQEYANPFKSRKSIDYGLNRSQNSTIETPDWFNESVDLSEPFKYYESTRTDDESSDFNTTLTNDSNDESCFTNGRHASSEHDTHFNRTESIESTENCSILFKQLMDLAESSFIKCLKKTEVSKPSQPIYSETNLPPVFTKFCKFCKNNREPRKFYLSHSTMNTMGEITCPILQQYRCELCGSTGTKAHTRSYCPFSKMIRETMPDINDTYEFYNKRSMIHSTDAHLFDNNYKEESSD